MRTVFILPLISTFASATAFADITARGTGNATAPEMQRLAAEGIRPKLVVVMSVDQLRADYLTRFADRFLPVTEGDAATTAGPGGFRWLMTRGAYMASARYSHFSTATGPGHATIMTGATLGESGIISNGWLTSAGLSMYCVEDDQTSAVGAPPRRGARRGTSSSPRNMQAETVGDALRMSNNQASKVVGIAIKDRASILMTGKNPTASVWFDDESGNWVSSSYYRPDGTLPAFAEKANRDRVPDRAFKSKWEKLLPAGAYARSAPETAGPAASFPKAMAKSGSAEPDNAFWKRMTTSPFGNDMVFETAKLAIEDEQLGQRTGAPSDILCLNFSSNDYVGHAHGPNSAEVQDITLRLDRQLSEFIGYLRRTVEDPDNNLLIVLSSDHGVAPVPDRARSEMRYDAGRQLNTAIAGAARDALKARFPDIATSGMVTGFSEPYIYLNLPRAKALGIDLTAAREAIAERIGDLEGVRAAYPRERIERGQLPPSMISDRICNGFHDGRSGDVVVVLMPFWLSDKARTGSGTSHGTPYNYDAYVPVLLAGPGIRPGLYAGKSDIRDIAPTLSLLLGIQPPASSSGRVLDEILK